MKILLWTLGSVATPIALVVGIGWFLPVRHRASRQATYPASPEAVFATITSVKDYPSWRSTVKKVDIVSSAPDKLSWRESGTDSPILFVAEEQVHATRLVTRIADPALPFGGTWTYELTPAGQGTTLRITEDGEVYNPLFRFVSRFVFLHGATLETYLRDLGNRYGTVPTISA